MIEKGLWRSITTAEEIVHKIPRIKNLIMIQAVERFAPVESLLKRPFDIIFSGLGLILSAWIWAIIWIAIMIEDGFPVLFRQPRVGKNGRIFTSYKFRSMKKSTLKEKINNQAGEHDPRVTQVGKHLRKSALDELPQLLNIFFGDMSFVGPRALLLNEIEINGDARCTNIEDIPGYQKRITVRPGLTGIAQIFAPRDILRRHKFKYDLLYIRKMNFLYDLRLIIVSFLVTFNACWEKRGTKLNILNNRKKSNESNKH
jgi:lipopolysaccharide/colanic/teichoic acid biosynthesis glycosyltransferase